MDLPGQHERVEKIITILRKATQGMIEPAGASIVKQFGRNPYLVLISCLLSLRTRDTTSLPASCRLFQQAQTPHDMIKLPLLTIEQLIFPSGFYRTKAKIIVQISKDLIDRFQGIVPNNRNDLMSLKGVGPKTAALVLADGFEIPAICVDTHVHRISNRLGLIQTSNPEESEIALQHILPKKHWREWNSLMVMWGQNICVPISPKCSQCAIFNLCPKIGVTRHR